VGSNGILAADPASDESDTVRFMYEKWPLDRKPTVVRFSPSDILRAVPDRFFERALAHWHIEWPGWQALRTGGSRVWEDELEALHATAPRAWKNEASPRLALPKPSCLSLPESILESSLHAAVQTVLAQAVARPPPAPSTEDRDP